MRYHISNNHKNRRRKSARKQKSSKLEIDDALTVKCDVEVSMSAQNMTRSKLSAPHGTKQKIYQ